MCIRDSIYSKKSSVLAITSYHSSPSPDVESNQTNMTSSDLIRSYQTCLLVWQQEVSENSQLLCLLSLDGFESHINSANNSLVAQLKISEASEKT